MDRLPADERSEGEVLPGSGELLGSALLQRHDHVSLGRGWCDPVRRLSYLDEDSAWRRERLLGLLGTRLVDDAIDGLSRPHCGGL